MSTLAALAWVGLVVGLPHVSDGASQGEPDELPALVAELLAERCAGCHSPESAEPRAVKRWDLARDLAATVRETELVVAGAPDDSDLFLAIVFDEMPPDGSDEAPLSEQERALVEAWILAGARIPVSPDAPADTTSAERRRGAQGWMGSQAATWVSHFHPMLVHFPIALLSVALLAELLAHFRRSAMLRGAATFCLTLGALASVPSATLGWVLAANTLHQGDELFSHRWLGVSTAALSLLVLWAGQRWPTQRWWMLVALAVLVGATGHTGGVLVFGADWLVWPG